jgi:hypothetical protein
LYTKLLHKYEFGQAHCVGWLNSIHKKLFYNFWTFIQVSTNFRNLHDFLEIKSIKNSCTVSGFKPVHSMRCAGDAGPRAVARQPATRLSSQLGPADSGAVRALPVVTARWPRVRQRAGVAGDVQSGDQVWENHWG